MGFYLLAGAFAVLAIGITYYCVTSSGTLSSTDLNEFRGRHVLITGGSSGLGREIGRQLARAGAIVTLVARGIPLLEEAQSQITSEVKDATVYILSCDVTDSKAAVRVVEEAEKLAGPIYALFCCAGTAKPGFMLDQSPEVYSQQMALNYMGAVNCVHPTVQRMVKQRKRSGVNEGRIIFISSTLGLTGMIGYSQYSPTKFALRGLAESLRQELLPYRIKVHIYYVATIDSPGNQAENLIKPEITKKIEEGDISDSSPATRTRTLLSGIIKDRFAISSDHITDIFMLATLGAAPGANALYESLVIPFAHWGLTIWRRYSDWLVLNHEKKIN